MKNNKTKLLMLEILSVTTMILPLLILVIVKKDEFLKNSSPLHLTFGLISAIVFAFCIVNGKLNYQGKRVVKFLSFFVFCYVFEPFLSSLKLISLMALTGQVLDTIMFEGKIKQLKKQIDAQIIANEVNKNGK